MTYNCNDVIIDKLNSHFIHIIFYGLLLDLRKCNLGKRYNDFTNGKTVASVILISTLKLFLLNSEDQWLTSR